MKILQYIKSNTQKIYRRYRLHDYINSDLITGDDFLPTKSELMSYDKLLVSDPRSSYALVSLAKDLGLPIVYDRTDNWSYLNSDTLNLRIKDYAISKIEEEYVINNADKITYSSYTLAPNKINSLYVPNGGDYNLQYTHKGNTKIATYIGYQSNKLDIELIQKLASFNPDWKFEIYLGVLTDIPGDNISVHSFIPKDKLNAMLLKCKLGIIAFKPSAWTEGMLPLKVHDYINNSLDVVYSNVPGIKGESNISKLCSELDINNLDLDSYLDKYNKNDWESISELYSWDKILNDIAIYLELK
jgi:hypothetical protein